MRKNKGKKYAFGVMAAWCLAVGAAALTGCGTKEVHNKITVESSVEERHRRQKRRKLRRRIRMSRSRGWRKTAGSAAI